MRKLIRWIRNWRQERLIRRTVHLSAEVMLIEAAKRLRWVKLNEDDERVLVKHYAAWLMADESRQLDLIDRPLRTIHLFLSEEIL